MHWRLQRRRTSPTSAESVTDLTQTRSPPLQRPLAPHPDHRHNSRTPPPHHIIDNSPPHAYTISHPIIHTPIVNQQAGCYIIDNSPPRAHTISPPITHTHIVNQQAGCYIIDNSPPRAPTISPPITHTPIVNQQAGYIIDNSPPHAHTISHPITHSPIVNQQVGYIIDNSPPPAHTISHSITHTPIVNQQAGYIIDNNPSHAHTYPISHTPNASYIIDNSPSQTQPCTDAQSFPGYIIDNSPNNAHTMSQPHSHTPVTNQQSPFIIDNSPLHAHTYTDSQSISHTPNESYIIDNSPSHAQGCTDPEPTTPPDLRRRLDYTNDGPTPLPHQPITTTFIAGLCMYQITHPSNFPKARAWGEVVLPLLDTQQLTLQRRQELTMEAMCDNGGSWSAVKRWRARAADKDNRSHRDSRSKLIMQQQLTRPCSGGWSAKTYGQGTTAGAKRMSVVCGAIGHAVDTLGSDTDAGSLRLRKLRQRLSAVVPAVAGVRPCRVASKADYKNAMATTTAGTSDAKFLMPSNMHVVRGKGGGVFVGVGMFRPNQVMTITGLAKPEWEEDTDGEVQEVWLRGLLEEVGIAVEQCDIGWHQKKQAYYARLAFDQERQRDQAARILKEMAFEMDRGWKVYERQSLTRVTEVMTSTVDAVKRELDETSQMRGLGSGADVLFCVLLLWADACGNMTAVKGRLIDTSTTLWTKGRSDIFDCMEFVGVTHAHAHDHGPLHTITHKYTHTHTHTHTHTNTHTHTHTHTHTFIHNTVGKI